MKRKLIILSIAAVLLASPFQRCNAQRTAPHQWCAAADISIITDAGGYSPRAELDIGRYTINGLLGAGIAAGQKRHPAKGNITVDIPYIQSQMSYDLRIAGSYTRAANLYLHTSIAAGLQFPDPFRRLPHWVESDLQSSVPYAGLGLGSSLEVFLTRKMAATLTISADAISSDYQHTPSIKTSFGLRLNI